MCLAFRVKCTNVIAEDKFDNCHTRARSCVNVSPQLQQYLQDLRGQAGDTEKSAPVVQRGEFKEKQVFYAYIIASWSSFSDKFQLQEHSC